MIDFKQRAIWIPVFNTTNETIPGCALMEVVANPPIDNGQDIDGNWLVRKPTINGSTRVIVNSEAEIPPGGTGIGHRETMAVLLYDTTEDLPLCDDAYGSKAGSWMAHRNYTGFKIDHAGGGRANAQRDGSASQGQYGYGYGGKPMATVAVPSYRYRCAGPNLQESVLYYLITGEGISMMVSQTNPTSTTSGWYCVGGQCVEAGEPPIGYNSGPYPTQQICADNCI